MRKLLFLLAGVLVAFAANAYQLKGSFTNNWQLVDLPCEYIFDGTQGEQQYGIDNNGAFLSNGTTFNGEPLTNTLNGNYGNDKIAANFKGTVRFEIVDGNKLKVSKVESGSTTTTEYKLKGTFTGNNWPLVALPCEYSFDGTQGEQEYGIGIEGKNDFFCNGTTFNGETLINTLNGNYGNDKIAANFKGTVRFEIVDGNKLKVSKVSGTESTAPAALYLSCDATNEGWKFGFDMTKDGNKFTTTLDVTANNGWVTFSTNKVSGWNDDFGTRYGSTENDLPPVMGTAYDMEAGSGNCWKLGKGTYTITVDFSGANPTVTFTTGTLVPVEKTYTIY